MRLGWPKRAKGGKRLRWRAMGGRVMTGQYQCHACCSKSYTQYGARMHARLQHSGEEIRHARV